MQPRPGESFEEPDSAASSRGGNRFDGRRVAPGFRELHPDEEQRVGWGTSIARILTSFAGMDPIVMSHCPRHEQSATWKLGLTLAIPLMLALLAGTYTLTTLTGSWPIGMLCGAAWAGGVFTIDLAVMATLTHATTGPAGSIHRNTVPSRASAWLRGLLGGAMPATIRRFALLRILMAFVLGAVMSHTLVMGIFNQRIFSEIESDRAKQLVAIDDEWHGNDSALQQRKPTYATRSETTLDDVVSAKEKRLEELRSEWSAYRQEIDALDDQIADLGKKSAMEKLSGNASGKGPGEGPYYRALGSELNRLVEKRNGLLVRAKETSDAISDAQTVLGKSQEDRSALQERNRASHEQQHQQAMQVWEKEYDKARQNFSNRRAEIASEPRRDLLYQTEYFHQIITRHITTMIWAFGIFSAVFILDLVPLLLKFYRRPGVYDVLVAEEETHQIDRIRAGDCGGDAGAA